ncbi:MAG: YbhB/YbcL family Raf kinase inhibitor-like protein [Acidimicrobiia bacterium]
MLLRRSHKLSMLIVAVMTVAAACSSADDTGTESTITATAAEETTTTTVVQTTTTAAQTTTTAPATTTTAPATTTTVAEDGMVVSSPSYEEGETIPVRHTCDGEDVSAEYMVENLPAGTASLVAVMEDPDAPGGVWDHWVVYDLPAEGTIAEDAAGIGTDGLNSWQELGYGGPCPPAGTPHRYVLTIYALDVVLDWPEGIDKVGLLTTVEPNILESAQLTGLYGR